jgi:hypothetical protein
MFEESAPFKQFNFVFKTYGFMPKEIFRRHRVIAFFLFLQGKLLLMLASFFQESQNLSVFIVKIIQAPATISILCKFVYFFVNFDKVLEYKTKLFNLLKASDDKAELKKVLRNCKLFSLVCFTPYMILVCLTSIGCFIFKSNVVSLWRPPIEMSQEFDFYLYYIIESIGNIYLMFISTTMDLFPICLMILLQSHLNALQKKFNLSIDKKSFLDCVKMHLEVKSFVDRFIDIFSPLILFQGCCMVIILCATLFILVFTVTNRLIFIIHS